jgi:hypothetical protein
MVTSPTSIHGQIIRRTGRATLTIRSEHYGEADSREWYVIAEGPIAFVNDDIEPFVRLMRRRYYSGPRLEDWMARPLISTQKVAVLDPESLSGYEWTEQLGPPELRADG